MWQLWVVIGWLAWVAIAAIIMIGKPVQPLTNGVAVVRVLIQAALIGLLLSVIL